jgi:hypothetical protein
VSGIEQPKMESWQLKDQDLVKLDMPVVDDLLTATAN